MKQVLTLTAILISLSLASFAEAAPHVDFSCNHWQAGNAQVLDFNILTDFQTQKHFIQFKNSTDLTPIEMRDQAAIINYSNSQYFITLMNRGGYARHMDGLIIYSNGGNFSDQQKASFEIICSRGE